MTPTILTRPFLRAVLTALCCLALAFVLSAVLPSVASAKDGDTKKSFNIPAGSATETLKQFQAQSGTQLLYAGEAIEGIRTNATKGNLTPAEALSQMFTGTGLVVVADKRDGSLTLRKESPAEAKNGSRVARKDSDHPSDQKDEITGTLKLDTFEVMGSKLLNMDIRRSRDDAQPYVVFNRDTITQSGATNLEDFLKQRLTMNTVGQSNSQIAASTTGATSSVNLRGLGTNQTLILIDGHRVTGTTSPLSGTPLQPDLNGIPLAAIERVEVLPATASGIYGGSATGGVVNVILRRDYSGAELQVTYDNTFETDAAIRRVNFSAGFTLEGGKTNVLLSASYSDQNHLFVQDRDIVQRARAAIIQNLGGNPTDLEGTAAVPLGATVNIRSVNNSPLFGPGTSNITFLPVGYTSAMGLGPLQANAGSYNLNLAETAQLSLGAGGGGQQGLVSTPRIESFIATVRRQFTPRLHAFLELAGSNSTTENWSNGASSGYTLAATAPNNPFGQAVRVALPITTWIGPARIWNYDRRVVGGVTFKLPREWQGQIDYTWNQLRYSALTAASVSPTLATTAISTGVLNVLRDPALVDYSPYLNRLNIPPVHTGLRDANLRLSGPLATLPAGPLNLVALIESREEKIEDHYSYNTGTGSVNFSPHREQAVKSAYLETRLPLFSAQNSRTLLRELELQLAARFDDYTLDGANTISSTTPASVPIVRARNRERSANPTIGLRYQPIPSVTLRASYGTGFLPPGLNQLTANSPTNSTVGTVVDPRRGNQPLSAVASTVPVTSGGNANLKPEKSESWSVGLIFTPEAVSGLRLSVDYIRIEKTDNIATLGMQQALDNEAFLPGRVTRGSNLPGDQPGWAGPVTALDLTSANVSSAFLEAYDVALDFSVSTAARGRFDFYAAATWQPHFETQLVPSVAVVENSGIGGLANLRLKFKANAGATWKSGPWTLGWNSRYLDSYLIALPTSSSFATQAQRQGSTRVPSQIYHDLFATYRFEGSVRHTSFLRNTEIQCGIRNLFNRRPPIDVGNFNYLYSVVGDPRLSSYYISVKRTF